jgi:hypothetical protein
MWLELSQTLQSSRLVSTPFHNLTGVLDDPRTDIGFTIGGKSLCIINHVPDEFIIHVSILS